MRCKIKTKLGVSCKNKALEGREYCSIHKDKGDQDVIKDFALGAGLGLLLVPSWAGLVMGATVSGIVRILKGKKMKKKVFISFDFDNDKVLKDFIIGQSKLPDSPFEVLDYSLKEAAPEDGWEAKANAAIRRSDMVLVIVGPNTYRAQGVLKEVKMARNQSKHIVQIIGYKDGEYTPVPDAGRLYKWNWENLKSLLS